jgi:pSer/pThr/pTyr-binding forkhead associated (FHA) protein
MSACLIPTAGGDAVPLRNARVYLGRAAGLDRSVPPGRDTSLCLLELIEGWWYVEDLRAPQGVRINGVACKRQKLAPNDELEFGRHCFRIIFETPKYRFGRDSAGTFRRADSTPSARVAGTHTQPVRPNGRLMPLGGGSDYALNRPRFTVGRRAPCTLVIPVPTVSGEHCELEFKEGFWFVRDLGSRNGIRINSEKCTEGWVLPGQRLTIGDQRFQIEYEAVSTPPVGLVAVQLGRSLMDQVGLNSGNLEKVVARQSDDEADEPGRKKWVLSDGME